MVYSNKGEWGNTVKNDENQKYQAQEVSQDPGKKSH